VRQGLLAATRAMDAYPEVAGVLSTLRARGAWQSLSNGDPDMLKDAVRAANLAQRVEARCR